MGCIVCATRGGEGSRAVQREAVKRAIKGGQELIFLYVVDMERMGVVEPGLVTAVRAELTWLGKSLVNIARQRARIQNIEANVVIREGNVREEISRFLHESQACILLLGATRGATKTIVGDDSIEQFAMSIQEKTGVDVEVIHPQPVEAI